MHIAVVGAGVSGLVVAHLLAPAHDVVVFEADDRAGGHSHTVRVDTEHHTLGVDTGFVVFNDRNYPLFERLLSGLGVASQPSDMSFGVADESGDFELASTSPNGLFASRAHLVTPWFHRMLLDVARCQRAGRRLLEGPETDVSLLDWLGEQRFSRAFVDRLMVPMASAIWSADPRQLGTFPARFLLEFFANHGMLGLRDRPRWRTVVGGSRTYVEALTRPLGDRLRLATPIRAICRQDDGVTVTPVGGDGVRFDEVVVAVHADQALRLLSDATALERELLGVFPYQESETVLHTDVRLLPRRRRAWASWNCHLLAEATGKPTITYHMNRLQGLAADREYCVTLNRSAAIDPARVIRTMVYAHPVYTSAGWAAQRRHSEISGRNHTHFCGAYWRWGFHEDGVASAVRVAEQLGAGGL
jgi:predicted NAD/FAD-binding protein